MLAHWARRWTAVAVVVGLGCLALTGVSGQGKGKKQGSFGTITTFATIAPHPGFPEGVAVDGNRVFVSGPARFGTAGTGPSAIQVLNRKTGQLEQTIHVEGEALAFEHALSNLAIDDLGRIYALSTQLGVVRFTKVGQTYVQEFYGDPLPDLPAVGDVGPGEPSTPTAFDLPPLPNDLVFDADGNLYVTDSLQATVFRYAPGGGAPQIWFQTALFDGAGFIPFGANGIRLSPDRSHVYIAVSTSAPLFGAGAVVRVPLENVPDEADLEFVHVYAPGEIPDQLAFAQDGKLFVSLALSNQIGVLSASGVELTRISSPLGAALPLDAPAAIAFDTRSKSLLVANHALLTGDPAHFAVLKIYVGDPGDPLEMP